MNEHKLFPTPEQEKKVLATVTLNIFRHAEKDGPNDVTQEEDQTMRLTEKGRQQAHDKGKQLETVGGVASGSPRIRTGETALHVSHARTEGVTGEETLEELVEKTGHKVWVNSNLDMPFDKNHPDFEELNNHYKEGRMLRHYVEMDQELVAQGGDRGSSIYGMQVYNITSLINRFARITQKMASIEERAETLGESSENQRVHNMGTHGSVAESFLVEVVKRLSGEEEKERLLEVIPNGVALTEGMQITFQKKEGQDLHINLHFDITRDQKTYTYDNTIPPSVIQDILNDFSPQQ